MQKVLLATAATQSPRQQEKPSQSELYRLRPGRDVWARHAVPIGDVAQTLSLPSRDVLGSGLEARGRALSCPPRTPVRGLEFGHSYR